MQSNGINETKVKPENQDLVTLQKDIHSLKSEKEKWFNKKEELKKVVSEFILKIREVREKKDKINAEVKELKKIRDEKNKEVHEKISKLKELSPAKTDKKQSPDLIKQRIDKLEETIETEVLGMNKEKQIMKEIGKLRQEYKEAKEEKSHLTDRKKINNEINTIKNEAQKLHKLVQEKAKESKKVYDEYMELSRKLKELNKEQEEAFDNFLKFKNQYTEIAKETKKTSKKIKEKRKQKTIKDNDFKKRKDKRILEENKKLVEEKLRKGQKLTTEDIIKLQGINE